MKSINSTNKNEKKKEKITLKCYFSNIPLYSAPRKEFIQKVSEQCGVSEQTVRNWCIYGIKPQSFEHVKVLSRLTGIKEEDLWD